MLQTNHLPCLRCCKLILSLIVTIEIFEDCCKPIKTWGRCCKPIKMQLRVEQRQQNGGCQFHDRGTVTNREQIKMATSLLDSLRRCLSNYDSSCEEKFIKMNEIKEKCMSEIYEQCLSKTDSPNQLELCDFSLLQFPRSQHDRSGESSSAMFRDANKINMMQNVCLSVTPSSNFRYTPI